LPVGLLKFAFGQNRTVKSYKLIGAATELYVLGKMNWLYIIGSFSSAASFAVGLLAFDPARA